MADAMGTKLPFLPFWGEEECKRWARYVMELDGPFGDVKASLDWCKFVNGKTIHPKLPSQIRCYVAKVDRNQRIRNCVKRAKTGIELLAELNTKLMPISITQKEPAGKDDARSLNNSNAEQNSQPKQSHSTQASSRTNAGNNSQSLPHTKAPTPAKASHRHSPELASKTIQNTPLVTTTDRPVPMHNWKEPRLPPAMPVPSAQALHNLSRSVVGVFCVGTAPAPKQKEKIVRRCKRCSKYGLKDGNFNPCKGRGGERYCVYYDENGVDKTPTTIRHSQRHCQRCVRFNGDHAGECKGRKSEDKCSYFQENGNRQRKRRRKL